MTTTRFNTLGQYHDAWAWVILSAPDSFSSFDNTPVDQRQELDRAFADLRAGFHYAEKKLKHARLARICRELIDMSYEAYVAGDAKLGAHSLQECEGMIWPGRKLPVKHAVEAERRAFGELKLFEGVNVSPYPYEGTRADLGPTQSRLYEYAIEACKTRIREEEGFRIAWAMYADGSVRKLVADSQKKTREAIQKGAATGDIVGAASAQLLPGGGLLVYHLEEPGYPFIAVMNLCRNGVFDPPRYHLNEPVNFSGGAATGATASSSEA
jgi:hypothetical protein